MDYREMREVRKDMKLLTKTGTITPRLKKHLKHSEDITEILQEYFRNFSDKDLTVIVPYLYAKQAYDMNANSLLYDWIDPDYRDHTPLAGPIVCRCITMSDNLLFTDEMQMAMFDECNRIIEQNPSDSLLHLKTYLFAHHRWPTDNSDYTVAQIYLRLLWSRTDQQLSDDGYANFQELLTLLEYNEIRISEALNTVISILPDDQTSELENANRNLCISLAKTGSIRNTNGTKMDSH